jgi:DNA-binding MarR family transcriptional regulator
MSSHQKNTKAGTVAGLEDHAGYWLRYVSNHVSHAFARRVEEKGITVAEWVILRTLYAPPSSSVSILAETTGLTRGAVSKLVDRLEAKRLISRKNVATDKRRQELTLTPAGRALVPDLAELADENDSYFFGTLSRTEREQLIALMRRLVREHHLGHVPVD